jgi:hypothetical protein
MGVRKDVSLTVSVLGTVFVAFVLTDEPLAVPFFVVGGASTLAFELVAGRDPALVRSYWNRSAIQFSALLVALGTVVLGARVAPSVVLSTMAGLLVTYLGWVALIVWNSNAG